MSTILLVVIVLAIASGITYFLMKKGKIADTNNNFPIVPEVPEFPEVPEAPVLYSRINGVCEIDNVSGIYTSLQECQNSGEVNDLVTTNNVVNVVGKQVSHIADVAKKTRKPATKKATQK